MPYFTPSDAWTMAQYTREWGAYVDRHFIIISKKVSFRQCDIVKKCGTMSYCNKKLSYCK